MLLSMCCSTVEQNYHKVCHEIINKIYYGQSVMCYCGMICYGSRGHCMHAYVHTIPFDGGIVHMYIHTYMYL